MTTVLVMREEGRILADSQTRWGQGRLGTTEKIVEMPDGSLVTGAGNQDGCFACFEFIRHKIQAGEEDMEVPYVPQVMGPDDDHSFTVLHLKKDRSLWVYSEWFQPCPLLNDWYAIGTGDDIVKTALHLGQTPREALDLACELDFNSGPPIVEMRV